MKNKKIKVLVVLLLGLMLMANPIFAKSVKQLGCIFHGDPATALNGPTSIVVKGSKAYVTSANSSSLSVFNVKNPKSIQELGTAIDNVNASTLTYATDVKVVGNIAYVIGYGEDSFSTFDISDPMNIVQLDTVIDGMGTPYLDAATALDVQGDRAYVVASDDGALTIFDVSDPSNITQLGVIFDDASPAGVGMATKLLGANSVFIKGNLAFITSGVDNALSIFDVSDPTNIIELDTIVHNESGTVLNTPVSVFVRGNRAYVVSTTSESLSIFDISDPTDITQIGVAQDSVTEGIDRLDLPVSVYVKGAYAYVAAAGANAITLLDVRNPSMITEAVVTSPSETVAGTPYTRQVV